MSDKSFIEVQFPVSKISKESYKERKAAQSQTLTGLGKWWGRKPLILIRATILGLLMPVSNDTKKDREIFLKILSMDDIGLFNRKDKSIPPKVVWKLLYEEERNEFLEVNNNSVKYKSKISKEEKLNIQRLVFNRMSYDEKLEYCIKAENIFKICEDNWKTINEHLDTNAKSIHELIRQLGIKRFGNTPRVGDCFSGGGSIPFEAARIGCNSYASDLNPIATLLSWSSINILGISEDKRDSIQSFLKRVYNDVNLEMRELECNEKGDKALAFMYCTESNCPECGWEIPLSTTWVVGERAGKVVAILEEDSLNKRYNIKIKDDATKEDIKNAAERGTVKNSNMICPHCGVSTPISSLRKDFKSDSGKTDNKLRKWRLEDITPNKDDLYRDRLYCIRWERIDGTRYYNEVLEFDKVREEKVIEKLKSNIDRFNELDILPTSEIDPGFNTSQPILERGWVYWRNLFNPRQLLINGLIVEAILKEAKIPEEYAIGTLALNRCCDYNSKLCRWDVKTDAAKQTFYNQAFNTLFNYGSRSWNFLRFNWFSDLKWQEKLGNSIVISKNAKEINNVCDIWITDPPYADAVNYHELSEFFIAWDKPLLNNIDQNLYNDSRRVLAVKGVGSNFNESMVSVYRKLVENMPDNGLQVVMFTHQDVGVWADLTKILWVAGLKVTAAWNIATETDASGIKQGNYVKGTVILVLRKQNSDYTAYLDELYPEIEDEVKSQIDSMRDLDDKEDPNFTDADYLLAAYAASLKVLTSYKNIEDIDVQYELSKSDSDSPIVNIINEAVKIAFDYLTPSGFDTFTWKTLLPEERFYIKGLDIEKDGVYSLNSYQELGRGFGVKEYSDMMASSKANHARLKTASEFAMKNTNENSKFGKSVLRNVLIALYKSSKEEDARKGKAWLRNEVDGYWNERSKIIEMLDYIKTLEHIENMKHWGIDAKSARILVELVRHDGV